MLNPQQRAAVEADMNSPLLVLAGAGSGKTSTMTRRIQRIVNEAQCQASQVLAITFTRNAVEEMRQRIERLTNGRGGGRGNHNLTSQGVAVSTIHSLCLKICRAHVEKLDNGLTRHFTLAGKHEQTLIAEEMRPRLTIAIANRTLEFSSQ